MIPSIVKKSQIMDRKELELPDTTFVRDIEDHVFQGIALQCLSKIEGIALGDGRFIDQLLGLESGKVKGIHVRQDGRGPSVSLKIEVKVIYGVSIPDKAEEIQSRVTEEITRLTGLHVSSVHVVFKDLIPLEETVGKMSYPYGQLAARGVDNPYSDEF